MILTQSITALPPSMWRHVELSPAPDAHLLALNELLAMQLGFAPDWLRGREGVAMLSGSVMPPGVTPIAQAYAGHQFGQFVSSLGDGRAILLGTAISADGSQSQVQLKGSGRTTFSRGGDGRAAIGPILREYLVSEAMHALGVPTTRALAAVTTGDHVLRERALPGAILTRVAQSFLRVGSFQYAASRGDTDAINALVKLAATQLSLNVAHANLRSGTTAETDLKVVLLDYVVTAQAKLVAQWMSFGFIHGVMNTDNMSISGETLDYGPCAFMDRYNPKKVFSAIDVRGRYAFDRQPDIARWNLVRLAEALLTGPEDPALPAMQKNLETFAAQFGDAYNHVMGKKLGLDRVSPADRPLIAAFLNGLQASGADYTQSFYALPDRLNAAFTNHGREQDEGFAGWALQWRARVAAQEGGAEAALRRMADHNPAIIPRNHIIADAILAAEEGDLSVFAEVLHAVTRPYVVNMKFMNAPTPEQEVHTTYCGT